MQDLYAKIQALEAQAARQQAVFEDLRRVLSGETDAPQDPADAHSYEGVLQRQQRRRLAPKAQRLGPYEVVLYVPGCDGARLETLCPGDPMHIAGRSPHGVKLVHVGSAVSPEVRAALRSRYVKGQGAGEVREHNARVLGGV